MKMKDSGVEWIGEIPEDWEMKKVRYFLKEVSEKKHPNEQVLSLYRDYGVIPKDSRDDNHNVTSSDTSGYKFVEVGNLVINKMKAWQGSLAISNFQGIISPAYFIYRILDSRIDLRFLHYALRNPAYKQEYMRISSGLRVGQWDLNKEEFKNLFYTFPEQKEQQKIADFLDSKIALIDQIIADTKRSIEELKAYKQSLITETVTKGLDPSVPMKDSGVEWIGEIPEGWKVRKAKYFGNVRNGLTYKPEQLVDEKEGILILRSGNIQDGKLSFEDNQYVAGEIQKNLMVKNDDILITSRNGSAKLIGKSAIINNNIQATFGAFMMLFTPNQTVNAQYFCYLLNSNGFDFYRGLFSSSTINQLTRKTFNNMSFPYPKKEIQKEIVLFLDERIKKLDDIIKDKNLVISENESYKKSLIYEYVTGKKQVN